MATRYVSTFTLFRGGLWPGYGKTSASKFPDEPQEEIGPHRNVGSDVQAGRHTGSLRGSTDKGIRGRSAGDGISGRNMCLVCFRCEGTVGWKMRRQQRSVDTGTVPRPPERSLVQNSHTAHFHENLLCFPYDSDFALIFTNMFAPS